MQIQGRRAEQNQRSHVASHSVCFRSAHPTEGARFVIASTGFLDEAGQAVVGSSTVLLSDVTSFYARVPQSIIVRISPALLCITAIGWVYSESAFNSDPKHSGAIGLQLCCASSHRAAETPWGTAERVSNSTPQLQTSAETLCPRGVDEPNCCVKAYCRPGALPHTEPHLVRRRN